MQKAGQRMSNEPTSDNSNSMQSGEQPQVVDVATEQERFQELAGELIAMSDADQAMRKSGTWNAAVDTQNTARLKEIIAQSGWPTKTQVGALAAHRAWLLAQHADHDRDFQKACLELMKQLPPAEVAQPDIAYLEDRVRVGEGRPQIYGTQFYTDKQGGFGPLPIEAPEELEIRRKAVGLKPFSVYRKRMEEKQAIRQQKGPEHQKFEKAMLDVVLDEIPTDFEPAAVSEIEERIKEHGLFLLGEMHGVRENAAIIYTLMKKFGLRGLALEWNKDLSSMVNGFLATNEINFEQIENEEDGRVTAAHFALIKKLRAEGLLTYLLLFDEKQTGSWDRRDEAMASNVLKGRSEDIPTLVVAGNFHTITEPVWFENDQLLHHPMGEHIFQAIPNLVTGRVTYAQGQFYNFGIKTITREEEEGEQTEGIQPEPLTQARFYRQTEGFYVYELPKAHAATVPKMPENPLLSNEPNAGTQQLY